MSSDSAEQPASKRRTKGIHLRVVGEGWQRPAMSRWLVIGGFGFIGTILRYAMQGGAQRVLGSAFPYGTLAVNVIGSFIVAFVATLTLERVAVNPTLRLGILVGFCGGFTTFSALSYETFAMVRTGDPARGALNLALHVLLGLAAVWAGYGLAVKI